MEKKQGLITNLIVGCVLAEFVTAELLVAIVVWKHPNHQLPAWLVNVFTVTLVACVPIVAGLRAYSIVGRLQLVGDKAASTKVKLSRILLAGIGGAYAVLILMIAILS